MSPDYSVIIPVRNEEYYLPLCIKALQSAAAKAKVALEIIVVLDRSNDRSEQIAISSGCKTINATGNLSIIRNAGARIATAPVIITVDADSQVSKNMFSKIRSVLANTRNIGGGVLIIPERISLGIFATFLLLLPVALWYRVSGGLFFVRKEDFFAINGFDETVLSAEDIDFAVRLKNYAKLNKRYFVNLLSAWIVTSCRKFDHFGDWFFLKHPIMCIKLLRNRGPQAAQLIWYNFSKRK